VTAATRLAHLPSSGRYTIDTETDVIEVDLDRNLAHILPINNDRDLADLRQSPATVIVFNIEATVGEPLRLDGAGWQADEFVDFDVTASTVLGITPAGAAS
jgi:hypothetical protein